MCGIFKLLRARLGAHDHLWCCNQHWMNDLPPCQGADISMDTPTPGKPPLHCQASSESQVLFWGALGGAARRSKQLLTSPATASSPGLSLLLYWKGSIQQPINYQHLRYSARHPAGYFESHCPLRQITGGWMWHLMTCSYFDWALILLAPFNATQVFQLTEVILWISSPGCG